MNKGNGTGDGTKVCGFDKKPCIEAKCVFFAELRQVSGGAVRKVPICGFGAMLQLLSELNQKTALPQQKLDIEIPKLFRGRG